MSKQLIEKLKKSIVVFDIDGVLAAYEFGENCHYASIWDEAFISENDNPYCGVNPLPKLQQFIQEMNPEDVYVCSVASPFEMGAKGGFVTKNYAIRKENILFVEDKSKKIDALLKIKEQRGDKPIAIVDDTVKTLDQIFEQGDFLTIHISSFFDF
ncbi:MAG: hypothetical protein MJZ28_12935 [Paludibacteraceae bacterium]|nr:hypothetical protein [Paludibacteraceae bacterium]